MMCGVGLSGGMVLSVLSLMIWRLCILGSVLVRVSVAG